MRQVLIIIGVLGLLNLSAWAEHWSTTNVQYLYGNDFDEVAGGDSVPDGKMETITLEHAGGWDYGKHFFFIDLNSANFASDKEHLAYAEWAPKVSLSKVSGSEISWGIIKDVFIAGEINQGDDFRAINLGLAVELAIPTFTYLDVNLYTRKDEYNDRTMQLTLAWQSKFRLFSAPLVFEGFFDYYGTDFGTEIITQPRLLVEGTIFSEKLKNLQAGTEIYYYRSSEAPWRGSINETVPQLMIKWIW